MLASVLGAAAAGCVGSFPNAAKSAKSSPFVVVVNTGLPVLAPKADSKSPKSSVALGLKSSSSTRASVVEADFVGQVLNRSSIMSCCFPPVPTISSACVLRCVGELMPNWSTGVADADAADAVAAVLANPLAAPRSIFFVVFCALLNELPVEELPVGLMFRFIFRSLPPVPPPPPKADVEPVDKLEF